MYGYYPREREVEKSKPTRNKRLVIESNTCRLTVRVVSDDDADSGVNVWLGMDYDSLPEMIIGQGVSEQDALTDAVKILEAVTNAVQEKRFPTDWLPDINAA